MHLLTLLWQCIKFWQKAKWLGIPHILCHVISFFSQNSMESIKWKKRGDEWYLYDANIVTECSGQIWTCILYVVLWMAAVWSLVWLCKVWRWLLVRGRHCLEQKCCCFGEIYSVCELFDCTMYLWSLLITLCRLMKKCTYMYTHVVDSHSFVTFLFFCISVWKERSFPTLPIAASVCLCLLYYCLIMKCLVCNTAFCKTSRVQQWRGKEGLVGMVAEVV